MTDPVRVRFAPSPTGYLHVGGARTALFNWLFARQSGGTFVLRMEDTDASRNTDEARRTIIDGLRWLGLDPDEGPEQGGPFGPYSQSECDGIYAEAVDELRTTGAIYPCFCTRERLAALRREQEAARQDLRYDGLCRELPDAEVRKRTEAGEPATWRLRVAPGKTVLDDMIRGEIVVDHADIEDIILVRGDGTPVYNLAVVIDDHRMGITHVLRGEDHLTNTFKQLIVFRALGWSLPRYGHLPLILGPAGEGKLSKRKHPEAALDHYIARDYHPGAVVNWLALLGWSYDGHTELMSREELTERFSVERINKAGARLNIEKLDHLSGEYIRGMSDDELVAKVLEHLHRAGLVGEAPSARELRRVGHLAQIYRERLNHFSQVVDQVRWLFEDLTSYEPKAEKNLRKSPDTAELLRAYADALPDPLPEPAELEAAARSFAVERGVGFGQLVHPLRAALTGRAAGPPLFDCLVVLGREEARVRLVGAAAHLVADG